jgi:hypothetical protein
LYSFFSTFRNNCIACETHIQSMKCICWNQEVAIKIIFFFFFNLYWSNNTKVLSINTNFTQRFHCCALFIIHLCVNQILTTDSNKCISLIECVFHTPLPAIIPREHHQVFYKLLVIISRRITNHIGGVMVNNLASSAVDRLFKPWSCQTKDYNIGICWLLS